MTDPLFKEVNVMHPRTGLPVRDQNGNPVSQRVQMTDEEVTEFLAEQAAQQQQNS